MSTMTGHVCVCVFGLFVVSVTLPMSNAMLQRKQSGILSGLMNWWMRIWESSNILCTNMLHSGVCLTPSADLSDHNWMSQMKRAINRISIVIVWPRQQYAHCSIILTLINCYTILSWYRMSTISSLSLIMRRITFESNFLLIDRQNGWRWCGIK